SGRPSATRRRSSGGAPCAGQGSKRGGPRRPPDRLGRRVRLRPAAWLRADAPCGQTPVLRVRLTRDHLAAIGAVTPAGRLLLCPREPALKGPALVRFLP